MTRPSDAELVKLLRREASMHAMTTARTMELHAAADALEAAASEPFEAKVERAAAKLLGAGCLKLSPKRWNLTPEQQAHNVAEGLLRAAGVEG